MTLNEFKIIALPLKNPIFRYAKRILKNREDAEEIAQDALIRIWKKSSSINDNSKLNFLAFSIAKNLIVDKIRSKSFKNKTNDIDDIIREFKSDASTPYRSLEYKDEAKIINLAIDTLPEKARAIVQLRDIEGYSTKETADILGIDPESVKTTLSRTRKKIREILAKKYDYKYND